MGATRQSPNGAGGWVRDPDGGHGTARPSRAGTGAAQPLRARWRPEPSSSGARPRAKSKFGRIVATYGWRVYALPVLLALSVLVVVNTVSAPSQPADSVGAGKGAGGAQAPSAPLATENPVESAAPDVPAAELPAGGEFTKEGAGTWHIVPGSSEKVGSANAPMTYTVEVEDGIDSSSYAGDKSFAEAVESTLSDSRSWTGSGQVALKRVDASAPAPDFRVSLTTPATNHKQGVCGYTIEYESSCYNPAIDRVVINLARWVRGATAFNGDLGLYRQYAINHEVGHALGNPHAACSADGTLAPVMMQQTFGVANDYVAKLNGTAGTDGGTVPADGKVCKPNAWPNPTARPAN